MFARRTESWAHIFALLGSERNGAGMSCHFCSSNCGSKRTPLGFLFESLRALPAFFDDADGDGIEDEGAMAVPLRAPDPANRVGVRGSAELAAGYAAKIVGNDVVVAHAALFADDAVDELNEFDDADIEAGFLADFADGAGGEGFAQLEHAAGQRPVALEGLAAATDEEHAAILDDDGAHAEERR